MKHKNKKRLFLTLFLIFALSLSMVSVSYAHSGRTDSRGGHKDNKNKSGLGSYHYHCGGNPAHLHPNGVCPYAGKSNTASSNSYTGKYKSYADEYQNKLNTGSFIPEIYTPIYQQVSTDISSYLSISDFTEYLGLSNQDKEDFKKYVITVLYDQQVESLLNLSQQQSLYTNAIFSPTYYQALYPDLVPLSGNYEALYNHFNSYGMAEGRQGSETFNVYVYMQNNPDLVAVFDNNLVSYYQHYLNFGQYEGRIAH